MKVIAKRITVQQLADANLDALEIATPSGARPIAVVLCSNAAGAIMATGPVRQGADSCEEKKVKRRRCSDPRADIEDYYRDRKHRIASMLRAMSFDIRIQGIRHPRPPVIQTWAMTFWGIPLSTDVRHPSQNIHAKNVHVSDLRQRKMSKGWADKAVVEVYIPKEQPQLELPKLPVKLKAPAKPFPWQSRDWHYWNLILPLQLSTGLSIPLDKNHGSVGSRHNKPTRDSRYQIVRFSAEMIVYSGNDEICSGPLQEQRKLSRFQVIDLDVDDEMMVHGAIVSFTKAQSIKWCSSTKNFDLKGNFFEDSDFSDNSIDDKMVQPDLDAR